MPFLAWVFNTKSPRGTDARKKLCRLALGLEQFGSQAGYLAALAGGQRDVPKAALASKGMDEHGQGVVGLAHIWGIDLAGVAGEDHLGAFADAGEDGLEGGWLQVLGFVHHYELLLQ